MNGVPVLQVPKGTQYIALGSGGVVFQESNGHVVKAPLKHDVEGCGQQSIEYVEHIESFSELSIDREKLIYRTLPKNPNILDCLSITDQGLHFPYHRLGNLPEYMEHNEITSHIRDRWIRNAIDAIAFIHAYGVVHADISPRNFLVADDLSIKLCDFAGSAIGDLGPLVEEEDRYRLSPLSPRTVMTDLFALGSLIYEISTGTRPYDEIDDSDEIERLYAAKIFPPLDGLSYEAMIHKCWTSQYASVDMLRDDFNRCIGVRDGLVELTKPVRWIKSALSEQHFATLALGIFGLGCCVFLAYQKRHRQ